MREKGKASMVVLLTFAAFWDIPTVIVASPVKYTKDGPILKVPAAVDAIACDSKKGFVPLPYSGAGNNKEGFVAPELTDAIHNQ